MTMEYRELCEIFRTYERSKPTHHLTAYITFSPESFASDTNYSERERTYIISSDNKAFQPDKGGYSVFGSCLDGKSDPCLRLDRYMAEEHGGKNGWIIEDCCLVGWLVSTFQAWRDYPEELKEQQLYYSHTEALDAMMHKLCEKGGLDMNTMKFKYSIQQGRVRDDDCWLDATHATLYDDTPDKWSWDIRIVRIYGPLKIVFEDIKEDKKNG